MKYKIDTYIENRRISKAFQEVWNSLPEEACKRMWLHISCVNDESISEARKYRDFPENSIPYGLTEYEPEDDCYEITIFKQAAKLTEGEIKGVIAHELAHVYREHSKEAYENGGTLKGTEDIEEDDYDWHDTADSEADELAGEWGYNQKARGTL